jgi:hypothetical protein
MVFTKRENLNILYDDQLVMVFMEHSSIHDVPQVLLVTLCEEHYGSGKSLRRLKQSLARRIFTYTLQNCFDRSSEFLQSGFGLFRGRLKPRSRAST